MRGVIPILVALLAVVAVPFLFRQPEIGNGSAEDDLVIISPHSEAIRFEFTRAFADYYRKSTGRSVHLDWRLPGGTTEIVRYLNAEFEAEFRNYWTQKLHLPWTRPVLEGFSDSRLSGKASSPAEQARKAFLNSDVGCGIDLFFGGGSFDFISLANRGLLVDSGVLDRNPTLFSAGSDIAIPQ